MERMERSWNAIVWDEERKRKANTKYNEESHRLHKARLLTVGREERDSENRVKFNTKSHKSSYPKSQEFPFSRLLHFNPIYTESHTVHVRFTLVHLVFDLYTSHISLTIKMSSEAAVEVQIEKVLSIWSGSFIV